MHWPGQDFWRRRWQRWLRSRIPAQSEWVLDQRRIFIFFSKTGLGLCAAILAIFVAGLNYGNNQLLGLSFLLASLVLVNIYPSYANLAGLRIRALACAPAFVGEPASLALLLASARDGEHRSLDVGCADATAHLHAVSVDQRLELTLLLKRRGWYKLPRLRLISHYPLGLLRCWTWLDLDQRLLVCPRPQAGSELPVRPQDLPGQGRDEPAGREDFVDLRAYRPGDALAQVAWRQSARGMGLWTKVHTDPRQAAALLDWDALPGLDSEQRLSCLCWWVLTLAAQGQSFGLRLPGRTIALGQGEAQRLRCLEALALFETMP